MNPEIPVPVTETPLSEVRNMLFQVNEKLAGDIDLLSEQQFNTLIKLVCGDHGALGNLAARRVLVDGHSQEDAMRETGAAHSAVSISVRRCLDAHRLIREAYPHPRSYSRT